MLSILLQADSGSPYSNLIMMASVVAIMYFFMIRPQMKKAKDEKKFIESIEKGSKVVTLGGIHGKIVEMNDNTIMLEVDKNVTLKVEKKAISAEATKAYQQQTTVVQADKK
ncbi:MAG: preprotein translocase subunit YajC [Bacteroidia bacterium]|nr:preprotein translocase subunit YajC [Bacteroidia bacterium]HQV01209.1 preprotein translocase subunit YajC [Bacteroidia bacterium]